MVENNNLQPAVATYNNDKMICSVAMSFTKF